MMCEQLPSVHLIHTDFTVFVYGDIIIIIATGSTIIIFQFFDFSTIGRVEEHSAYAIFVSTTSLSMIY